MSKAVMMSVQPEWCAMIANLLKTIEVRKTRPNLKPPFKCYIYCTKGFPMLWKDGKKVFIADSKYEWLHFTPDPLNGKVIGEFVCDRIYCYASDYCGCRPSDPGDISTEEISRMSCLSPKQLYEYEHSAEPKENCIYLYGVYGLHISKLKIYDEPLEITQFIKPCPNSDVCESCAVYSEFKDRCGNAALQIRRPPQSWYYVEEGVFSA